jgi:hypothetical protein
MVNFIEKSFKMKGKNVGQLTPNIESDQVNLSSNLKQQYENRSYDPYNIDHH